MSLFTVGYVLLLVVSVTISGRLAIYAWRRRAEPGVRPFAGLMTAVSFWAACTTATTLAHEPSIHLLFEDGQWAATVFVPVFWILFTLAYTGQDELVTKPIVLVLSVVPMATLALGLTNPFHGLIWAHTRVYVTGGIAIASRQPGGWYWVFVIYSYALIGIGTLQVLRLVFVSKYLFVDQAVLLVVGTLVPLLANVVSITEVTPLPGIDFTPFAFTVTGISFGYALFRRRLFELLPATRRLGRDAAIASLDDSVLVLDTAFHVVYLNRKATAVLDCDQRDSLGVPVADLLDTSRIEFDVPDALAELEIGKRIYEARASPITDRHQREIGHTLVLHDITARKDRERRLRGQRDELEALDTLNELVRDVTGSFVNATNRDAIERVVCNELSNSALYTEASVVFDSTDGVLAGDGGLTDANESTADASAPIVIPRDSADATADASISEALPDVLDTEHGSWATLPLGHDRSIYGALVLYTTRPDAFGSRERAVLAQFAETMSQAISAVENRRLLLADTVTELEFECPDAALAELARETDCELSLRGLVPASDEIRTYYDVTDGRLADVLDAATEIKGIANATVINDTEGVVEFVLDGRSALLALSTGGVNVRSAEATPETYRVVVEVAPETDVRALVEYVRECCPGTTLAAKHDHDRSTETGPEATLPEDALSTLTDRQREVLEAAYRGGYFRWPRDRTAEEVAESIGISSPTLHKHLRRAEERIYDEAFDSKDDAARP